MGAPNQQRRTSSCFLVWGWPQRCPASLQGREEWAARIPSDGEELLVATNRPRTVTGVHYKMPFSIKNMLIFIEYVDNYVSYVYKGHS